MKTLQTPAKLSVAASQYAMLSGRLDHMGIGSALNPEMVIPRKANRQSGVATATTSLNGAEDQFNETKRLDSGHPGQDAAINLAIPDANVGQIRLKT
jgi:hypothetical protein